MPNASAWPPHSHAPCMHYPEQPLMPGRVTSPAGDLLYTNAHGNLPAMAEALGEKLSESMRQGTLGHLSTGLDTLLQTTAFAPLAQLLSETSQRLITQRLRSKLPPAVMRAITLLADSSGVPLGTVLRAHLMPETILWFRQTLAQPPIHRTLSSPISASSILSTSTRRPLLGVNFHHLVAHSWPEHTTLAAYHSPRAHSYVAATTAGLIAAGHCAMNSAGLVLVLHPLSIHGISLQGAPVGLCTDAIMRKASSLEQALEIIRGASLMTPFGFLLLEGDTGRALVVERSPTKEALHWFKPDSRVMAYRDLPLSHTFRRDRIETSPSETVATATRQARQHDMLHQFADRGTPDMKMFADYLSDMNLPNQDASAHEEGPRAMSAACTAHPGVLASVIFEPAERRIWIAAGKSPTSRGYFLPFELRPGQCKPLLEQTPHCVDPSWTQSLHGQALELYRQACSRIQEDEPPKKLLLLLEHAIALWPHEANLHVACGLLALKANALNRARGAFERALELEHNQARRAEISLYLAMSIDLGSHTRGQAKHLYRQIASEGVAPSRVALFARKKRRRRLRHDEVLKLPLDLLNAGLHL